MEPMTLAVAGVAAGAILLIALGVAMSGDGSGVNARLERYASGRQDKPVAGGGGLAAAIQSNEALAQFNKVVEGRDFGANLAREIARADLKLKPSEYLMIWAGTTVGIPLAMILLSPFIEAFRSPLVWIIGGFVGFFIPRFWLSRRKNSRLNAFNKQLPDTITLF